MGEAVVKKEVVMEIDFLKAFSRSFTWKLKAEGTPDFTIIQDVLLFP